MKKEEKIAELQARLAAAELMIKEYKSAKVAVSQLDGKVANKTAATKIKAHIDAVVGVNCNVSVGTVEYREGIYLTVCDYRSDLNQYTSPGGIIMETPGDYLCNKNRIVRVERDPSNEKSYRIDAIGTNLHIDSEIQQIESAIAQIKDAIGNYDDYMKMEAELIEKARLYNKNVNYLLINPRLRRLL